MLLVTVGTHILEKKAPSSWTRAAAMIEFSDGVENSTRNSYVFVVGVGRSGTSLLQSMLAGHSAIAFLPETSIFRRLILSGELTRALHEGGVVRAKKVLDNDGRFLRTDLSSGAVFEGFRIDHEKPSYIYRQMLLRFSHVRGKSWIGDKDPRLVEFLPLVHKFACNAHVVHIVRDPKDVLASKKNAEWSRNRLSIIHILVNRIQLRLGRDDGTRLFGRRYHEIAYEDLITQPEAVLQGLCSAMGLRFEVEMLDFGRSAKSLTSSDEVTWKRETFGPLLANNTGKWQQSLEPWEAYLTELLCGRSRMTRSDNSDKRFPLSLFERMPIHLLSFVLTMLEPFYLTLRKYRIWRSTKYV